MRGVHRWPGDADRPALALHCSMGSSAGWGLIADRLAGRVALTALDAPGHGRAAAWDGSDLHGTYTRAAAALIDRPVDLIGHSLGATVALRIAVGAPHAVRSLTLIEPVLFAAAPHATDPARAPMTDALARGDRAGATAAFLDAWGDAAWDTLPPPVQARLTDQFAMVLDTGPVLAEDAAQMLRPGGLEAIDAPVMLISGERSPAIIAAIADALAERLPDVARAVIPGAGHMAPLTHPDEAAGLIAVNLDRA